MPYTPIASSYLPSLVFGALSALIAVSAFIFISILLLRDRNVMSKRTGGAMTLTIASIVLISGLWCYALSPPSKRYEHVTVVRGETPTIGSLQKQTYYMELVEGERLVGDVNCEGAVFTLRVFDPDGALVRSAPNVTTSGLSVQALRSGSYRVEIENTNKESIRPFVYISREVEVSYRILQPAGQWLSLVSTPIFALGLWAFLSNKLTWHL